MGDNTHHQDQVITLVSLRPTNNTVKAPGKLIPEEDEEDMVLERDCVVCINEWIIDAPEVILVRLVDSLVTVPNMSENDNLQCSQRICYEHQDSTSHYHKSDSIT
jgi:hypothetical protein